jgi:hypothetical protein
MFCLFANINLFAQSDKKTILFNFANSPWTTWKNVHKGVKMMVYFYEKSWQKLVNFIFHSRTENGVKKRFLPSSAPTFSQLICHLWLLRVSYVASDTLTCGFWRPHSISLTLSKATSDNPKA